MEAGICRISEVYGSMRLRLAMLLIATALLLSGCGYWVVEDAPVQVGSAYVSSGS